MKKIIYLLLVFVLTIIFIPNAFASNRVNIESINLIDKSETIIINSKPNINGMNLEFDLSFLNVGDYAKYEVVINNNSNKDYYIDNESKFTNSEYISYKYEFANNIDRIKPNSNTLMYITIKYNKKVPSEKLVNGIYKEENAMRLDLTDVIITNPNTYINIIFLVIVLITLIVITIINITKKKKILLNVLLIGLLLIPITTYALERITIKAETKIIIEESRNVIETRYSDDYNGIEKDFWQYDKYIKTITLKNKIEEPSNYAYKFDVSEEKNNSIIAYLLERSDNPEYFDLYIMTNGYIYANPDSSYMFGFMTLLSEINNLEYLKTTFSNNMQGLFYRGLSLKELDLSHFDTSNVTDMSNMFVLNNGSGGHGLLKTIDVSSFDTSKVTDISNMFVDCGEIEELDLSTFDTSNVTNMRYLIVGCSKLTNLDLSSFDTSKVIDMSSMLSYNKKLISVDLSSFDTSNVTGMGHMFRENVNLEHIYVGNKWNVDNVAESYDMFYSCSKLPHFDQTKLDKTNANTSDTGYLTLKS